MRKTAIALLALGLTAALAAAAIAAPLFVEDFSYATGLGLNGTGGWAAHSGAGTNPQTVNLPAGGLVYAGYPGSTSGEDNNHAVVGTGTGNVYAAVMINVASSQTTGDYLFHFFDGLITGNIFRARVFVKSSPRVVPEGTRWLSPMLHASVVMFRSWPGRPSCENGKPRPSCYSMASSSVCALVVIVTSSPRTSSMES